MKNDFYVSDEEYILVLRNGNAEAYAELFKRYFRFSKKKARQFLDTHNPYGLSEEDLISECLVSFQITLDNFVLESGHFYPYWASVSNHDLNDYYEYHKKSSLVGTYSSSFSLDSTNNDGVHLAEVVGEEDFGLREIIFSKEMKELVKKSKELRSIEKKIFSLIADHSSFDEVIEILKISKSTLYRYLRHLRLVISEFFKITYQSM